MTRIFLARERSLDGRSSFFNIIEQDTLDGAVDDMLCWVDRPMALYAVDTDALTIRDVSQHAVLLAACRVCDGRISLTDGIRDFIERYSMPGSLIPAAA